MICALVARAYELDRILLIADPAAAHTEGWIHLPTREPLDAIGPI